MWVQETATDAKSHQAPDRRMMKTGKFSLSTLWTFDWPLPSLMAAFFLGKTGGRRKGWQWRTGSASIWSVPSPSPTLVPAMRSDTALGKFWFSVGDLCGKTWECVTMVVCVYLWKLDSVCVCVYSRTRQKKTECRCGWFFFKVGGGGAEMSLSGINQCD